MHRPLASLVQVEDTRTSQQGWKREQDLGDETGDENGDPDGHDKKSKKVKGHDFGAHTSQFQCSMMRKHVDSMEKQGRLLGTLALKGNQMQNVQRRQWNNRWQSLSLP